MSRLFGSNGSKGLPWCIWTWLSNGMSPLSLGTTYHSQSRPTSIVKKQQTSHHNVAKESTPPPGSLVNDDVSFLESGKQTILQ
eukprot:49973-Amphidinium_carterae.1